MAQEDVSGTPVKKSESGNTGESGAEPEELYDLVIPPGTPQTVITDITKKFDVDVVERKERLYFANMDGDQRILLAFRGRLDVMKQVEPYFYGKMKEFIDRK